jgi:beta-lactamase class D
VIAAHHRLRNRSQHTTAVLLITSLLTASCTTAARRDAPPAPGGPAGAPAGASEERPASAAGGFASATGVTRSDWRRHFEAHGAEGTFVLYDVARGTVSRHDTERAARRFLPASTFKIFSALAALDAGVVGVDDVLPWDRVVRDNEAWDQDQSMRDAFQRSTVWLFQELVRRVGAERMQALLSRERYGNADMSGGVDRFWLDGGLRISADEQVAFLERLHARALGFTPAAMDTVAGLLVMDRGAGWVLRGKTGWTRADGDLGWLVGWAERDGRTWFYALNLTARGRDFQMFPARAGIARAILREAGAVP